MRPARPAWRPLLTAAWLTALAVALSYQVRRPVDLAVGTGGMAEYLLRDVYGGEGGFRWTQASSAIVFPEPGPGADVRVEVDVAGWRPRGTAPPRVRLTAGGVSVTALPGPRPETLAFNTRTSGVWRSDLVVGLASDTFTPGPDDPRALGVRLSAARLLPLGPWRPQRPPLRPLVLTALAAACLAWVARRLGGPRAASGAALACAVTAGCAFALARPLAALALPWALAAAAALAALAALAPGALAWLAGVLAAAGRAAVRGAGGLRSTATLSALALGTAAFVAADRSQTVVEWDVGSGRAARIGTDLGAYDSAAGVRFRTLGPRARLDLGDFGSGAMEVALRVSAPGPARQARLGSVDGRSWPAALSPEWEWTTVRIDPAWGFRPGPVIAFAPEAQRLGVRLTRVRLTRADGWPAGRVLAAAVAAAALVALAVGAAGLAPPAGAAAALATLLALGAGVAADAGATLPFVVPAAAVALAGALVALLLAGLAQRASADDETGALGAGVRAAGALGFMGWLAAATFPLYRGGHFVFHSSIAEEIWKGRFLIYYLPYPGSMLSRQAQWGDVIVPHPCLYHVLVAPLAALPRAAFYAAEKAVLALLLLGLALIAARLAARAGGPRAAAYAAVLSAVAVPGYQLLGLGHLMALLGCFAGALALAFVGLRLERLRARATFVAAVAALTFAFLSYTATLLFVGLALALALPAVWRREPAQARALAAALGVAAAAAFGLYYVNWAWPFLKESVPRLLHAAPGPAGDSTDRLARLLAQPGKLAYSFGSWAVPLLGLAGLALARDARLRPVLLAWAALLPLFCGLDLFFNFLLKHHYFTLVPVAVGGGLLLARLETSGRAGRVAALLLLAGALALGLDQALAVGGGLIP